MTAPNPTGASEELGSRVRRTAEIFLRSAAAQGRVPTGAAVSAGFVPRDQDKNHAAIAAVLAAFRLYDDLTPLAMQPLLDGGFPLARDFAIDPEPLYAFNAPAAAAALFRATFQVAVDDPHPVLEALMRSLARIETERLLGRGSIQKMGYVRELVGHARQSLSAERLLDSGGGLARLLSHTLELLRRRKLRSPPGYAREPALERTLREWEDFGAYFSLHRLFAGYPQFNGRAVSFFGVFADVVVETIAMRHGAADALHYPEPLHFPRRRGIECSFSRRDWDFVLSGDAYGDCTASRVRSQVDDRVANIHWTVYAWLFDPYYRVIEVTLDGKRAMKCHILPLKIHDRPLLMLDAIEVVPQLRERKDGSANPDLDKHLYANRLLLLERLFAVCGDIATRMGLQAIYVEKFSNAKWVRDEIERLPDDSYHISEVEKPYEAQIVAANIRRIAREEPPEISEEIQARNPWLMNRQMRRLYKDVGVLRGRRDEWSVKISAP